MNSFSLHLKCMFQDIKMLSTFPKNAKITRWLHDNRVTIGTSYKIECWHVSVIIKSSFSCLTAFCTQCAVCILYSVCSLHFVPQPYALFSNKYKMYDNWLTNNTKWFLMNEQCSASKPMKAFLSLTTLSLLQH